MPRHDELYVPAPKTRIVPCADCQRGIEVGWKRRNPARCVDCACVRREAAMRQMHDRAGPYYDRWAWAMIAFLRREMGAYRGDAGNLPDRSSNS